MCFKCKTKADICGLRAVLASRGEFLPWPSILERALHPASSNHRPWQRQGHMVREGGETQCYLLFCPLWFISVERWLFSFPGTSLIWTRTWLSSSCSRSQHARKPLCKQTRSSIHEFLTENCEFSVTVPFLSLFSIFWQVHVLISWCIPKRLQRPFLLCAQFSWHSSRSTLITCLIPLMFPCWAIHHQAHDSLPSANTLNDCVWACAWS